MSGPVGTRAGHGNAWPDTCPTSTPSNAPSQFASSNANAAAPMIVRIPGLLRSYTAGAEAVEIGDCATVADALAALETRYPGLRFRIVDEQGAIRPHIKLFVDGDLARDLAAPAVRGRELMIVGALSGG